MQNVVLTFCNYCRILINNLSANISSPPSSLQLREAYVCGFLFEVRERWLLLLSTVIIETYW